MRSALRRIVVAVLAAALLFGLVATPASATTRWTSPKCTSGWTDTYVTVCSQVRVVTSSSARSRDFRDVYLWYYPSHAAYNVDNVTVGGYWSGHNHPNYHVRSVSAPYTSSIHCTVRGRLDGFLTWGYSFTHYHHCW